jgi:hypothetical protein
VKKLTIASVAFFVLIVALIGYRLHDLNSGERKMLALLSGDTSVDIISWTTKCQQRRLQCTDTDVLMYLKEAMMKHPPQIAGVGRYSYKGCFKFKGGGTFERSMLIGTNGFELSVGRRPDPDELPTHSVLLIHTVPEKVAQIFAFFNEPEQQAAGTVFILESGKPPRRERDESLVSR